MFAESRVLENRPLFGSIPQNRQPLFFAGIQKRPVGFPLYRAKFEDLEPAVGPGLWIQSPVGPIRIDYGFRLRDDGDEPSSVFHFMIGNPF